MKAVAQPTASPVDVTNRSGGSTAESFTDDRSIAVFKLGLDISPLRPRQRYVVRALLQRLTKTPLTSAGEMRV